MTERRKKVLVFLFPIAVVFPVVVVSFFIGVQSIWLWIGVGIGMIYLNHRLKKGNNKKSVGDIIKIIIQEMMTMRKKVVNYALDFIDILLDFMSFLIFITMGVFIATFYPETASGLVAIGKDALLCVICVWLGVVFILRQLFNFADKKINPDQQKLAEETQ